VLGVTNIGVKLSRTSEIDDVPGCLRTRVERMTRIVEGTNGGEEQRKW
jgi:hypothetical protein